MPQHRRPASRGRAARRRLETARDLRQPEASNAEQAEAITEQPGVDESTWLDSQVDSNATQVFDPQGHDELRDAVIDAATGHLGAPYSWGADGPGAFDCSGFVLYVLRNDTGLVSWGDDTAQGIAGRLPATSSPEQGDCVFFSSGGIQHVELVTGLGSQTIGASGGGSSTFGDDPEAKVQYGDWSADSRAKSFGSIAELIAAKAPPPSPQA